MHSLKTLRRQAGLTLAELATRTGASLSLLSKFERGERTINGKWVKTLADALDVEQSAITGENVKTTTLIEGSPWFLSLQPFTIDTDEMNRLIPPGATVYVEPNAETRDGWVYLLKVDDEIHPRRCRLNDGPLRFESDSWSTNHRPFFLGEPFSVIGRVRGWTREV